MLARLEKLSSLFYRLSKWVSVGTTLLIVLLNCANLVARWFFRSPFDWILEVSLILFVYAVMFIVPVLFHDGAFIRMHLIQEILGRGRIKYVNLLADTLILAFLMYLVYQGLRLSLSQFEVYSRGLGIPRIYVTIPVCLGAAMSIPAGFVHLFRHLREPSSR